MKVKISLGYSFPLSFLLPPLSSGPQVGEFRFSFVLFFNIEMERVSGGSVDCSLLNVCLNKG